MTCPAGKTWIITDAMVINNSPPSNSGLVLFQINGVNAFGVNVAATSQVAYQWHGKVVLQAGDVLAVYNQTAGGINTIATGYELAAA